MYAALLGLRYSWQVREVKWDLGLDRVDAAVMWGFSLKEKQIPEYLSIDETLMPASLHKEERKYITLP